MQLILFAKGIARNLKKIANTKTNKILIIFFKYQRCVIIQIAGTHTQYLINRDIHHSYLPPWVAKAKECIVLTFVFTGTVLLSLSCTFLLYTVRRKRWFGDRSHSSRSVVVLPVPAKPMIFITLQENIIIKNTCTLPAPPCYYAIIKACLTNLFAGSLPTSNDSQRVASSSGTSFRMFPFSSRLYHAHVQPTTNIWVMCHMPL